MARRYVAKFVLLDSGQTVMSRPVAPDADGRIVFEPEDLITLQSGESMEITYMDAPSE